MYWVIGPLCFAPLLVYSLFACYWWKPLTSTVSTAPCFDLVPCVTKVSSCTVIKSLCERFEQRDPVWRKDFLNRIVVIVSTWSVFFNHLKNIYTCHGLVHPFSVILVAHCVAGIILHFRWKSSFCVLFCHNLSVSSDSIFSVTSLFDVRNINQSRSYITL